MTKISDGPETLPNLSAALAHRGLVRRGVLEQLPIYSFCAWELNAAPGPSTLQIENVDWQPGLSQRKNLLRRVIARKYEGLRTNMVHESLQGLTVLEGLAKACKESRACCAPVKIEKVTTDDQRVNSGPRNKSWTRVLHSWQRAC